MAAKDYLHTILLSQDGSPRYPCIPAIAAFKSDELHMGYFSSDKEIAEHAPRVLGDIKLFYEKLPEINPAHAAYVSFFQEQIGNTNASYRQDFWKLLSELRRLDPEPWPDGATADIYDPNFQYQLLGKPIFATGFWVDHPHVSRRTKPPVRMLIVFGPPSNVEPFKDDLDRRGEEGRFHHLVEAIRQRDDVYSASSGGRLSTSQYTAAPVHSQVYEYQGMKTETTEHVPLDLHIK